MRDPLLTDAEITEALGGLKGSGWRRHDDELVRLTRHDGFTGSLTYVNTVGGLAEEANHHPDIDIRWNKVTLTLTTHDSGGLTERDTRLAGAISALGPVGGAASF